MDHDFWHARWEKNEIGFHLGEANPLLVAHFGRLGLAAGDRVFLPLCGKTRDIGWLLAAGVRVVGAELSPLAVAQLFDELGVTPAVSPAGALQRYAAEGLEVFVGDVFALAPDDLGPVDAIYDRAALIALPEALRARYAAHLMALGRRAPQLLVTVEYDPQALQGPPFPVLHDEVRRHYGAHYRLSLLDSRAVEGGLKGKCPATEHVWIATPA
jgi:thiopurine S-methyltransferase